ncbi:MAG: phosphoglycerate dehydrogenase [Clostridia bacterium]|nr:phosphoglycerate dehydrogenase [Clostridia bacterium]
MFNIKTMNKIAACGLDLFEKDLFTCGDDLNNEDGILVRSASLHEYDMPENLKAIARAGAGVNNIPIDACSEKGIVVFNTPGANANAVKELTILGLFMASRKVSDGINWAKTLIGEGDSVGKLVEKGKGSFAGNEIAGKKLGVIGLGAIGIKVANTAHHLDMDVIGYDPFISVKAAWELSRFVTQAKSNEEIFASCDYITIHAPLTDGTRGMINKDTIAMMKDGVKILNFSRDALVNDDDMKEALESGKVSCYVTDFPNAKSIEMKNCIAIPHLGASTEESEDNCAKMAVNEISDYLLNGNITNSVNLPNVSMPKTADTRICLIHKNIPQIIGSISTAIGDTNIENMLNQSKKDYAYTMLDVSGDVSEDVIKKIQSVDGMIKVRVIK